MSEMKRCFHCASLLDTVFLVRIKEDDSTLVELCGNCAKRASELGSYEKLMKEDES